MDTSKVTRIEVINHWSGEGRVYSVGPVNDIAATLSLQDDGRTLKVFIDKRKPPLQQECD